MTWQQWVLVVWLTLGVAAQPIKVGTVKRFDGDDAAAAALVLLVAIALIVSI